MADRFVYFLRLRLNRSHTSVRVAFHTDERTEVLICSSFRNELELIMHSQVLYSLVELRRLL